MEKVRILIDKNYQTIRYALKVMKEFTGYALMYWGESILGVRQKYRLISLVIENILQSQDMRVYVIRSFDQSLSVRFQIEASLPDKGTIDPRYFVRELILQLGCEPTDVTMDIDDKILYIEITKTAISNLEKGKTPYIPKAYNPVYLDEYIEEARQIVLKEGKGTPELLQERLGVGYARAARILDELETIGILTPPEGTKPRKLVN